MPSFDDALRYRVSGCVTQASHAPGARVDVAGHEGWGITDRWRLGTHGDPLPAPHVGDHGVHADAAAELVTALRRVSYATSVVAMRKSMWRRLLSCSRLAHVVSR